MTEPENPYRRVYHEGDEIPEDERKADAPSPRPADEDGDDDPEPAFA